MHQRIDTRGDDIKEERLAGFKVPKRVKIVPSLPKGGTGKILKRELRDEYSAELRMPS